MHTQAELKKTEKEAHKEMIHLTEALEQANKLNKELRQEHSALQKKKLAAQVGAQRQPARTSS